MDQKMTKQEYMAFAQIRYDKKLTPESADIIATYHAKYFNHQFYIPCTCSPTTWNQWIAQLNDIYDNGYI